MLAVIIPAYNRGRELEEALKSLMVQTKKMFITIVVDDASQEDLSSVVNKYAKQLHIVYLKQENNQGPGAARKRGVQWCFDNNIEFIMFLDSDDLLLPKAIERLSKEISITNSDIIVSDIQGEDKLNLPFIVENNETVWTHGKIYRASFLKRINLNFLELRTNEDLAFNTVAFYAAKANKKVGYIKEQHYIWKHNKNSITRSNKDVENLICQLSEDFIRAQHYSLQKFQELGLKLSELFPKIVGIYTYAQYLKFYERYDSEIEKLVKEIYSNPEIKKLIKKQADSKEKNIFLTIGQASYFLGKTIIFNQTVKNFVHQYTDISVFKEGRE